MSVLYPAGERVRAEKIAFHFQAQRMAAARWLGFEPAGEPVLHLVDGHAGMMRIAGRGVPGWAIAVTMPDDTLAFRLDLLDTNPRNNAGLVAAHEAVHQVLNHPGGRSPYRLPRWFEEGLCVYHAGVAWLEPDYSLERLAAAGNLPRFEEADRSFSGGKDEAATGYALGQAVVTSIVAEFGHDVVRRLVRHFYEGMSFDAAFLRTTGVTLAEFEARWRERTTPKIPLLLFVVLENINLALLWFGALLVAGGYLRWRLKRESALRGLESQGP